MRCKRQPQERWQLTRQRIRPRDRGKCQGPYCQDYPEWSVPLKQAHVDHIHELSRGGRNDDVNLRILCRRCHCLRANHSHQGMIMGALRDGIIPANWREWVWEG